MPRHTFIGRPYNTTTRLGQLMEQRGLKVREVAAAAGIAERAMSNYLAGRQKPSPMTLNKLVRFFNVPPDALRD